MVAVVIPPPQLYVVPDVVELATRLTVALLQFKFAGGAIDTFGGVVFAVTVVEALAVHPLRLSVAVTVIVPGVETTILSAVFPPPQL